MIDTDILTDNYGNKGVVILSINLQFLVTSKSHFQIQSVPAIGSVRILQQFGDAHELIHLAVSRLDAEAWLKQHQYTNTVLEDVAA